MPPVIIRPGMCDKCGGSMVNVYKGVECEDCGNKTFRKEK